MAAIDVYLERGTKRTFACAVEWPGWCRSGRDEAAALGSLLSSAPRYAAALAYAPLRFRAPKDLVSFNVVQRLRGNATTDFGAPGAVPEADKRPLGDTELRRAVAILGAAWGALDEAASKARGKQLAKGPRGGGRDLAAIVRHVTEAEAGYLSALGWKAAPGATSYEQVRAAILDGLALSARGDIPARGPRGGRRWKPRFFVRRAAWHALDHAWEIEDRSR